ncbi:MAG: RpiB/LacA/LacB family sugar-phosphate isomerase [Deltaproteobacteria bacterium]
MRIGICADHGGYDLKQRLLGVLLDAGNTVVDFGASRPDPDDDYPQFVIPLAQAVCHGEVARGIAICGSGVGACIAANKVKGARAALITDNFSAHQGVEDDDMNILCLGGQVVGFSLANELVTTFLNARFKGAARFRRRLKEIANLERGETTP